MEQLKGKLKVLHEAAEANNHEVVRATMHQVVPIFKTPEEVNATAEEKFKDQRLNG